MIVYVDTSVLARVYLGDQSDGAELSRFIYSSDPVVTSQLTDVEIASALARARRAGALTEPELEALLDRYAADASDGGAVGVVALSSADLSLAQRFVQLAPVRSLDAIHLAACTRIAELTSDEVRFLSRDNRQIEAANLLGIALAEV